MRTYNDDLSRILVDTLKNIDYFSGMSMEILTQLAFSMEVLKLDTDQFLYNADDSYPYIVIILHGCVEISTRMDKVTEFPIDYLGCGGILNAHHSLIGRQACVSVRCLKSTIFYTLNVQKLFKLS